ncbi:hypothetical protein BCR44DRAFT_1239672 [Catenaria anguillulae PL171]|uniref:Uncharacterized protein n=1 Tax=Catenaria anguillulae PL171 TaxID=765915 RepID=A0A1Y2HEP4_9FUNG|nr:hypothetical protein BCR44DRAFT_1239672 [Catenaria anguillulae PL171]
MRTICKRLFHELGKGERESQAPNEKPKDVPPAIAPAKADNNSDPPIESVPEPTTTAAKPTAAQPKSIKPAKQSRASSKPKPAEQLPPKPKEPTEGDVRLYQTRLDAIAPNDLVVDNASQTHIAAKELCEQIGSSFTAPVIDASMPLRKVLAEAALLRARAAYLSGKLDDCDAATEVVFRNSPGIPSVQMDLVLFKYHMLMQKGQNDAQPTDRPGEKSACPREIEPATSASRHLATVEPSKTPLENAQDLTVTERVLVEQVSALGGDVDFAIEKIRSTRNLAQSNSEITHATIEPESPSEAANTDREPQARSSCSYLVKSSQPNLGTSSQENFARSSQGNLARSSQPNFAKKSQDTLQKVGHPSSASASRSKLSTSSPEPTSNNVSSAVGLVGGSIDASKTVLASEPNSDAPGETSVEPVLADVAVQPLSQVSAEPALPSPISAEAEYTDDFDDRNPRSVSNPVATEIPLAKSVSGSANALAGNQSQSSHTLSSKHRLNDDKRSAEKLSTESGVASLQESEASVDPAALPLPASVATSRQLLTSGSEDSSTPAPVDPSTVPLPASVAASQVLIPSSLSTHHESSVQPEDIPLPLSVAGSTLLLNSQQSPKPGQRSRSRQNLTNANKGSKSYLASGPKAATGSRQSLRQLDPANIPLPASTANSTLLLNQAGKSGSQVVRPSSSGASSSSKRAKGSQKLHGSTSSLRNRPEKSLTALVDKDSQSMSKSQPLRNGSQRIRSVGDEDRMDQLSGGREVSQNEAAALPLPASRAESKMWLS